MPDSASSPCHDTGGVSRAMNEMVELADSIWMAVADETARVRSPWSLYAHRRPDGEGNQVRWRVRGSFSRPS